MQRLICIFLLVGCSLICFSQNNKTPNGTCNPNDFPNTPESQVLLGECYFKNKLWENASEVFTPIYSAKQQYWRKAGIWLAKINAQQGNDSVALQILTSFPQGTLHHKLLSKVEFNPLNDNKDFISLKKSFEPGFNIWTLLLALITVIGLVLGVLLLLGKSRFSAGENWMAVVIFAFVLILCAYLTIWTRYVSYFPYLRNTWPFLTLVIGPAIYFYLKSAFKENYTRKEVFFHFLTPLISCLLLAPAIIGDISGQRVQLYDATAIASSATLLTSHIVLYTVLVHFLVKNDYQVDANIKTWTGILNVGLKLYCAAFLSYFILVNTSFFNPQWDYAISIVMAIGILTIGYMALLQKRVFSSEPIESFLPVRKYKSSNLTPSASESIKKRLERLLEEDQVFKENELRLDDLASYLDINRHQLSQVINEYYQINFFDLMNRYRVNYVKRALADPSYANDTIIQIAYEAGFNNKASFNRYFKLDTGLTPSAYRIKATQVT